MNRTMIVNAEVHATPGQTPVRCNVAIDGGLVTSMNGTLPQPGDLVIEGEDALVVPAFVDIHTHVYWGATSLGIHPEVIAARSGTGTFVDAGSAGAGNIEGLEAFIANPSPFNVLAFVNIAFPGIYGFSRSVMVGEAEDIRLIDLAACLEAIERHRDLVVGVKVRAGRAAAGENGAAALAAGLKVAEQAGLPVMCHIDLDPPHIEKVLETLRPGDILTHCCRPEPNAPIDGGRLRQAAELARERGVLFDIGHGKGSFSFTTCRSMLDAGFAPDLISSDVHTLSIDGPAFDILVTIDKLIALGMGETEAIAAATARPAEAIGRPDLGRIAVGLPANIAVIRRRARPTVLTDTTGATISLSHPLTCEALFVRGEAISLPAAESAASTNASENA